MDIFSRQYNKFLCCVQVLVLFWFPIAFRLFSTVVIVPFYPSQKLLYQVVKQMQVLLVSPQEWREHTLQWRIEMLVSLWKQVENPMKLIFVSTGNELSRLRKTILQVVAKMDVIETSWLGRRSYEHMQKWCNRQLLAKQFELKLRKARIPTPLSVNYSIGNMDAFQILQKWLWLLKAPMHINWLAKRHKKHSNC